MTHLLAAVLQVAHEALLHGVKVGELLRDGLVLPLHVLGRLLEVLAALDTCRRDLERPLQTPKPLVARGPCERGVNGRGRTSSSALAVRTCSSASLTCLSSEFLRTSCCLRSLPSFRAASSFMAYCASSLICRWGGDTARQCALQERW